MKPMDAMQSLGRALMLPIAVLPVAGLLLRFGQPDLLDLAFVAAAGGAIFSNLGLLFAIGVGVGLARGNHGAAGLAGVVCFLVASSGVEAIVQAPPAELARLGVPLGIASGILAGAFYNRWSDIRLPEYLAFFGGRRFVPIAAGCAALLIAALVGLAWPWVVDGMDAVSQGVVEAGGLGLFFYGVLNRVLIVTGLHHIINNFAWFLVGDYGGVTGDLKRFFAGDPHAGAFMSGFFPVMMFGLPAACLAMFHTARPERRKAVGGMLLSLALTSFLTGVTEPIEFTFMFLAPLLYALHAVLTGAAMVTMDALDSRMGFSFSAGVFDWLLNYDKATRPWLLLPVGAVYFALYYGLFRFFILRYDLATPGRERGGTAVAAARGDAAPGGTAASTAAAFVAALGGRDNLESVEACTTRLRLVLRDRGDVDDAALRALGARGVVQVGSNALQVVLGPIADQVAGDIRAQLGTTGDASPGVDPPARPAATVGDEIPGAAPMLPDAQALRAALGGAGNLQAVEVVAGRVLVSVHDAASVDAASLACLFARGVGHPALRSFHLLHADPAAVRDRLVPTG